MKSNVIAELVLGLIAAARAWLRAQPVKSRRAVYAVAALLAVVVIIAAVIGLIFVPGFLAILKAAWLVIGPIAVLVATGLAHANADPE